jgi:predicted kinase
MTSDVNTAKLIMLCGLPASGKSTLAEVLHVKELAVVLSSDDLRDELYGDVDHQDDNDKVFIELHRRAKLLLNSGTNVILDSTNISSKRRKAIVEEFKKFHCEVYYFSKTFDECVLSDGLRERTVGKRVIDRMYKSLQVPTFSEGWNEIYIVDDAQNYMKEDREYFENLITNPLYTHQKIYGELADWNDDFQKLYNLPQDSKWHTLSASRHSHEAWKYVLENYQEEDKFLMLCVAIFHDVGKAHCKNFKEGSRYANFISHENVSSQIACSVLSWLGYDKEFILNVCELVQLHMRLTDLNRCSEESGIKIVKKLKNLIGEEKFVKLKFFREADEQAH